MRIAAPVDDQFDTLLQTGLKNWFIQGTGRNSLVGWSGTPDVETMTPEQKQRYEEAVRRSQETPEEREKKLRERLEQFKSGKPGSQ